MDDSRPKVALIVGAGYSKGMGGYTTAELADQFLAEPKSQYLPRGTEREVTRLLKKFWGSAFGFDGGGRRPSLSDHFTVIDLAANSGHSLGAAYDAARLRAVRRLSLHRLFALLAHRKLRDDLGRKLMGGLKCESRLGVVSLNWDRSAELSLGNGNWCYAPREAFPGDEVPEAGHATPVFKLHGSANWAYCDCCRVLSSQIRDQAKPVLHRGILLRSSDLALLGAGSGPIGDLEREERAREKDGEFDCTCGGRFSTRVGTFSYRKDYALGPYQAIWYSALRWLIMARHWLFVGYSMPEADFEFRHILKTAQMARRCPPSITVVLGGDPAAAKEAADRYRRFFGSALAAPVYLDGWEIWCQRELENWVTRLPGGNQGVK